MVFCHRTLTYFRFPPKITKLIINYITTSKIAVLINGTRTNFFSLSYGILQGDPLFPYIFILCMELMSDSINYQVDILNWDPLKIDPKGPKLLHLFFTDGLILIAQANPKTIHTIHSVLTTFCSLSREKINSDKSKVLYSKVCSPDIRHHLFRLLHIPQIEIFGKYLDFFITTTTPKSEHFLYLLDNIKSKLANWKLNFLSQAGRLTLIRSTLIVIQAHVMQYLLLLQKICQGIDKIQCDFL